MRTGYQLTSAALVAAALIAESACANDDGFSNNTPYTTAENSKSSGDDDTVSVATSTSAVDPAILTLAADEEPACIAVDDDFVFWVRPDGTVGAVSTTNVPSIGSPTPTYQSVNKPVLGGERCGIVRDGNYLYVTSFDTNSVLRFTITKTPDFTIQFGADVLTLPGFSTPTSIAVDDQSIYVTELDPASIRRLPKPGVADGGAGDVFPGIGPSAGDLVVDATSLYWSSTGSLGESLFTMPKTGGTATSLSSKAGLVHELGAALYFQCFYQLCTVPAGGGLTTIVQSSADVVGPEVHGLALYQQDLYYANGTSIHHFGTRDASLFGYSETKQDITLLAQRNRVVWTDGKAIFTRGTEQ